MDRVKSRVRLRLLRPGSAEKALFYKVTTVVFSSPHELSDGLRVRFSDTAGVKMLPES